MNYNNIRDHYFNSIPSKAVSRFTEIHEYRKNEGKNTFGALREKVKLDLGHLNFAERTPVSVFESLKNLVYFNYTFHVEDVEI